MPCVLWKWGDVAKRRSNRFKKRVRNPMFFGAGCDLLRQRTLEFLQPSACGRQEQCTAIRGGIGHTLRIRDILPQSAHNRLAERVTFPAIRFSKRWKPAVRRGTRSCLKHAFVR